LIVDIFGICVEKYLEDRKGHVSKSLTVHELQSCRLAFANSFADQWNAKSMGLPYSIKYPAIISIVYQREKVQYFNNKNVITLVIIEKG